MAYQYVPPNWKVRARIWIIIVFVMLCGADYLLIKFAMDPYNAVPMISAVAILGALCSKAMLIGMWRRLAWARYALIATLFISIMAFGFVIFLMVGTKAARPEGLLKKPLIGMALEALAIVPLGKSRSIRKQMHPLTGRD